MKSKNINIFFLVVLSALSSYSQNRNLKKYTIEDLIALGIENNTQVQINKTQISIAENNIYPGNADLLPTISLNANAQYANNQTEAIIRTFQPQMPLLAIDESNVINQVYSAVVQADYQVLGGFSGKYRFKVLKKLKDVEMLQEQVTINGLVTNITELSVGIAKLQESEELINSTIDNIKSRLSKVEERKRLGQATGLNILQIKTNLNDENSRLINIQLQKRNLMKQLNNLVGLAIEEDYDLEVNYVKNNEFDYNISQKKLEENNPIFLLSKLNVDVKSLDYKIANSAFLPKVSVFANYGYVRIQDEIQPLAEIDNIGYTLGARFTLDLFNGSKNNRRLQSAKLENDIAVLNQVDVLRNLSTALNQEIFRQKTLMVQLEIEEDNLKTFEENFSRSEDLFFNGQLTLIDLKDAQNSLINAKFKISELKYDVLLSDVIIKSYTGELFNN
ncbi:MAG: TolC family protein [Flavobacterium sp.]